MSQPSISAGSIDENGIINNLKKSGFTDFNSLCELIGNSIDAKAHNIRFVTTKSCIYCIDDGNGMNIEQAKNMFNLGRANPNVSLCLLNEPPIRSDLASRAYLGDYLRPLQSLLLFPCQFHRRSS